MNSNANNLEEEDGIYNTPLHNIEDAMRRYTRHGQYVPEKERTKLKAPSLNLTKVKRTSRYDSDDYALPDLSTAPSKSSACSSPECSVFLTPRDDVVDSVLRERNTATKGRGSKKFLMIICILLGVVTVTTVLFAVLRYVGVGNSNSDGGNMK